MNSFRLLCQICNKSLEVVARDLEEQRYGYRVELMPLSNTEQPAVAAKKLGEDSPQPEDRFGKEDTIDKASDSDIIHHWFYRSKPDTRSSL